MNNKTIIGAGAGAAVTAILLSVGYGWHHPHHTPRPEIGTTIPNTVPLVPNTVVFPTTQTTSVSTTQTTSVSTTQTTSVPTTAPTAATSTTAAPPIPIIATTSVVTSELPKVASSPGQCHLNGMLPDPVCTPGVINPNVAQANITSTICKSGWTTTVRPPTSYTNPLKIQDIQIYGFVDTNPADYELDHKIPLSLGGNPTDPKNLWPEPIDQARIKDSTVENVLRKAVCAGRITLDAAQRAIATDWTTAVAVTGA